MPPEDKNIQIFRDWDHFNSKIKDVKKIKDSSLFQIGKNTKTLTGLDIKSKYKEDKGKTKTSKGKNSVKKDTGSSVKIDKKTLKKGLPTDNNAFMDSNPKAFLPKKERIYIEDHIKQKKILDKFNKRDLDTINRLLNAVNADKFKSISFFTEGTESGLGTIKSQTGELMGMMFMALPNDSAENLYEVLMNHMNKRDGGKKVTKVQRDKTDAKYQATRDWLEKSFSLRKALLSLFNEYYDLDDPGEIVDMVSWDREETVNAMGGNYDEKTSTVDVFIKIKDPKTNKYRMVEISLKKSFLAMIFNGGLRDVISQLENDNISHDEYGKISKETFNKLYKADKNNYDKYFKKNNGESLDAKGKRKLLIKYHEEKIKNKTKGWKDSNKIIQEHKEKVKEYINNTIKTIVENKKTRGKFMGFIKNNLPIEDVIKGNESMLVEEWAITKNKMKEILGTDDWDEIKEKLLIKNSSDGTYYLAYQIEGSKNIVNIANIRIREESTYSRNVKFELVFPPESDKNSLTYKIKELAKKVNESLKILLNDAINKIKISNNKLEDFFSKEWIQS